MLYNYLLYPAVIKHGVLEEPPFSLMIFLLKSSFMADFPACHVS
jgi:hypothetical protein